MHLAEFQLCVGSPHTAQQFTTHHATIHRHTYVVSYSSCVQMLHGPTYTYTLSSLFTSLESWFALFNFSGIRVKMELAVQIVFRCEFCNKPYTTQSNLTRHINSEHLNNTFTCEICKREYNTSCSLTRHLREHNITAVTGSGSFRCTHCSKSFQHQQSLRRHELKQHNAVMEAATALMQLSKVVLSTNRWSSHIVAQYLSHRRSNKCYLKRYRA